MLKPLKFAARDGFAHLDRVQNLPRRRSQRQPSGRSALAIPKDAREALAATARDFAAALEAGRR